MSGHRTVITAESVLTMDPSAPTAEALVVTDGVIAAVGDLEEIRGKGGPGVDHVDLPGTTVIPGLVESHVHTLYTAMTSGWADCRSPQCATIADVQTALRDISDVTSGWVRGWGYDDTLLAEMRHPTRADLDAVSTTRPIVVSHISGHFAVANSVALAATGVDESSTSPDDPGFRRGPDGRLNGLLWEIAAVARVLDQIPRPEMADLRDRLRTTLTDAVRRRGITTLHDLAVGIMAGSDELGLFAELDRSGDLPLHIIGYLRGDLALSGAVDGLTFADRFLPGQRFRLAGVKFWADGSIQGLSAALRYAYQCQPDHCGDLLQSEEELGGWCAEAAAQGAQIAVHANGDAALEATVRVLAPLQRLRSTTKGPHRLEHCQVSTPEDLDRLHTAGLGVSFFVNHVYYWGDRHERLFLGEGRAANLDPLAWADERGQRFGLHSDCPITPMDPLRTIWSAVSRRTRDGKVLGAHQRLGLPRAIQAMTSDSAWLTGDQDLVGSLTPGKRADLVAVDTDLTSADDDALHRASPAAVMVEGTWA